MAGFQFSHCGERAPGHLEPRHQFDLAKVSAAAQ